MAETSQNFNSLIRYIKRKVGSPINLLEFSDDDLYDIIREDVLPEISQYIGKLGWVRLDYQGVSRTNTAQNENTYLIKVPDNEILIDVLEVYTSRESVGTLGMMSGALNFYDPRDTTIMNAFIDMLRSLDVVQTYTFIPPKTITFDLPLEADVILECKFEHTNLNTVPSDIYRDFVKPLSIAEVKENLAANREKFESITTPFGPVNLNYQQLREDARMIKEEVKQKFEALPHDHLISFID